MVVFVFSDLDQKHTFGQIWAKKSEWLVRYFFFFFFFFETGNTIFEQILSKNSKLSVK